MSLLEKYKIKPLPNLKRVETARESVRCVQKSYCQILKSNLDLRDLKAARPDEYVVMELKPVSLPLAYTNLQRLASRVSTSEVFTNSPMVGTTIK
jgi:hypothetical protein